MLFLERSKEYMMMEGKKILLIFLAAVAAGGDEYDYGSFSFLCSYILVLCKSF